MQAAVVIDKSHLSKPVHKVTHQGTGGADHLCQSLLTHFGNQGFWSRVFTLMAKQEKQTGKSLFTGIEQLVHEAFFNANVAGKNGRPNVLSMAST